MNKLKIAFMWHFHQPFYKIDDEFMLPWVRLHANKDYFDLIEIFYDYPNVKNTINIVPSLFYQIDDYINGNATDKIQILSKLHPNELSAIQKKELLDSFFICNYKNMICSLDGYKELYGKYSVGDLSFSDQEIIDLQVYYNLVWFGQYSGFSGFCRFLRVKGKNFTVQERDLLIEYSIEQLKTISKQFLKAYKLDLIDICVSPEYHPILPLVIDNSISNQLDSDNQKYINYTSASKQVENSINYVNEKFNIDSKGMWPSEGSVSIDALKLMAEKGIEWIATDEGILALSKDNYDDLDKYFAYNYDTGTNQIKIFFRDRHLSDKIGFTYSQINPDDAVNDFMNYLYNVRNRLINAYGEEILNQTLVSIILDGENCWEFYPRNGIDFLHKLYNRLQYDEMVSTNYFKDIPVNRSLNKIHNGSWINANYDIWIGHKDDRSAWQTLAEVRKVFIENQSNLQKDKIDNIEKLIRICEGSDWYWWYGDEHFAPNKYDFDTLFRKYIKQIYSLLDRNYPYYLNFPLYTTKIASRGIIQHEQILEVFEINNWATSGLFIVGEEDSSMQYSDKKLDCIYFNEYDRKIQVLITTKEDINSHNLSVIVDGINYVVEKYQDNMYYFEIFKQNDNSSLIVELKDNEIDIIYPRDRQIII